MVFGFGNRNAGLEELREKMDLEVSFWKRQLDKCVHEKDYWLAMAYAAQRQVRVLEAHHRMQQEQQTQLCSQLENAQKRLEQCSFGLVTSRVMAPPPEPLPSPPRDATAAESEAVKKLKLKLLSVEAQLKKADVLARRGEDRSDALGQEVTRLRSELECARCTISAHAHEADQLRKQLVAARGLGDDTAGQAAWLATELQKAQGTVQQLRAELANKDEMLGLLRLQLSDYVAAVGGSQCASGTTTPTMMRESLAGAVNAKLLSLLTPRSTLGSNGGCGSHTPRSALTPHALTPRASDQNTGKGTFHRSNTEPNLAAEDGPAEFRTSSTTNQKTPSLDFTFLHDQPATGAFSAVQEPPSTPNVALPTSREASGTARRLSQLQQHSMVASHQLLMTDSEAQGSETARSYDFSTPITQADFAPYLPCPPPKLLVSQPLRASSSETESDAMIGTVPSGPATTGTTTGPATVSAGSSSRAASPEPADIEAQPAVTHNHVMSSTARGGTLLTSQGAGAPHAALQHQGQEASTVYGSEMAQAAFAVGSSGPSSDAEVDVGGQRRVLTPQITLAAGCRDLADVLLQSLTGDNNVPQEPGASLLPSGASADHALGQPGAAGVLGDVGSGVIKLTSLSDGGPPRSSDAHQHVETSPMAAENSTPWQDGGSMRHEDGVFEQDGHTLIGSPISAVVRLGSEMDRDELPGEGEVYQGGSRLQKVQSEPPGLSASPGMQVELLPTQVSAHVSTAQGEPVHQLRAATQAPAPAGGEAGEGDEADFNVSNIRARFAAFEMASEQKPLTPGAAGSQSLRIKPQVHPCARTGTSGITHRLGSLRERTEH